MRSLAFAAASVALLAATSAAAQEIYNIQATAGSSFFNPDGEGFVETQISDGGAGRYPPDGGFNGGATYNSFVDIGPASIFFESSNVTSQGDFSHFSSYSELSFSFEATQEFNFHSEITPQGLGLYLADTSGGCLFSYNCVQVSDEDYQFAQLDPLGENVYLGGVTFSFEIFDNGNEIYNLSGALYLTKGLEGCNDGAFCILSGLGTAAETLNGFTMQTHVNDFSAIAFAWDATDVSLGMGIGDHNITYRTTVTSFTNSNCLGPYETVCLIAYSGFGDPIGRGGAIDALRAPASLSIGTLSHMSPDLITGLNFSPQELLLPYFDSNGDLILRGASQGAVPEPGTWGLMILGFGTMGAALRRRRIPAHI